MILSLCFGFMRIPRKCKTCENEFLAIKETQLFCCRKCFKKDYYKKTKIRIAQESFRRPVYNCPICSNPSSVEFDPIKSPKEFYNLVCPYCGIPRKVMVEQHSNPGFVLGNSMTVQFVINSAIISSVTSSEIFFS